MITLLLIISHLIGDFVFQTSRTAEEKKEKLSDLLKHCMLYTLIVAVVLFTSTNIRNSVIPLIIIAISHFTIDLARIYVDKKGKIRLQTISYFVDQALHLGIMLIIAHFFDLDSHIGGLLEYVINIFGIESINNSVVYILIYLVILQPTAVTVKKMLSYVSGQESNDKKESITIQQYNVGYIIGILERIIVSTLVLQNQLAAIGLVLAAKSLARFNQLNDREFAEKYLVGTLTSITISIISTLVLKNFLIKMAT
jgi:hypothetical protein